MSRINGIYSLAIEQTKKKIYQDIDSYLENKEILHPYESYRLDRIHYIEQLWVNVWLNKITNDLTKNEKKSYLSERDFQVIVVDRKLINQLFRTEIRNYQPFDIISWLDETFSNQPRIWQERYQIARKNYLRKQQEEHHAEKRRVVQVKIEKQADEILEEQELLFYLYVRHHVAKQVEKNLAKQPKFRKMDTFELEKKLILEGTFTASEYDRLSDFLEELTGEIHKTQHWGRTYYQYETYYYQYEKLIAEYLYEIVPKYILKDSPELVEWYRDAYDEVLTTSQLMRMIRESICEVAEEYLAMIQEEYITDLLELARLPFNLEVHQARYWHAVDQREKRKAEELAELQRKKEEEVRILEDIFGREYNVSFDRNIHYVLHVGDTNTGKTYQALNRMKLAESGLYLGPLRLLALEVYDKLNGEGIPCSLKTGEEEKMVANARHSSSTVEMFHEKDFYDVIVIDEAQMMADKDRGFSWYKAITKANANEVHIIGSRSIKPMLLKLLGDAKIEIYDYHRETPLEVESREFQLKHTKKGDALVCFSRRNVLGTASRLQDSGYSVSMIYGSMPPETRKKQMQRFIKGETSVIVSTDAIGMGLNLPIRRIVFLENEKFDGTKRRFLTSQEVKQIAGRAGRKGLYNVGKVAFTSDIHMMKQLLEQVDEPVVTFAIAPTNAVFERFQKYYHNLGTFFELWQKFDSPIGTNKASLQEERELYKFIQDTEIEGRLSMMDLYGFLHLPFSTKEPLLIQQWRETMYSIIKGHELPEPKIRKKNLEDLELSYKAIGLHLLFLYRLDHRTEAVYWERIREELSNEVHEHLKTEVKNFKKECKRCGKKLPWDFAFPICDSCHSFRFKRGNDSYHRK